jgi:hypothetical protein
MDARAYWTACKLKGMSDELTEGGQPIYRHEAKEREGIDHAELNAANREALERHLEAYLGGESMVFHELISDVVHVDVVWYKPTPERDFHVLCSMGMSDLPMNTPPEFEEYRLAEVMIALPSNWPISQEAFEDERHYFPVRWVKQLARMPHQYDTWLGYGHTIPNGDPAEPMAPNTKLSGVVLLPPILLDDEFTTVTVDEDTSIHLWAIVPLYPQEMDLKLRDGVEALFDGFEKHGVNELLQVARVNIAQPQKQGLLGRLFKS